MVCDNSSFILLQLRAEVYLTQAYTTYQELTLPRLHMIDCRYIGSRYLTELVFRVYQF